MFKNFFLAQYFLKSFVGFCTLFVSLWFICAVAVNKQNDVNDIVISPTVEDTIQLDGASEHFCDPPDSVVYLRIHKTSSKTFSNIFSNIFEYHGLIKEPALIGDDYGISGCYPAR